jgi:hypothetical protein
MRDDATRELVENMNARLMALERVIVSMASRVEQILMRLETPKEPPHVES